MNVGMPIDDIIRETLYQAAKRIIREKINQVRISQDGCEGSVETSYQFACIGSASGIRFTSTVDTENGTRKTSFIIPESELGLDEEVSGGFMWIQAPPNSEVMAQKAWLN